MTRTERKLFRDTALLGLLATLLVVLLDVGGMLEQAEQFLYDRRARLCQDFTPPPTDQLVHIDIDDRALELVGHWPWPRERLARIVDEMRHAGLKSFAADIFWSEPDPFDVDDDAVRRAIRAGRSGTQPATAPTTAPAARRATTSTPTTRQIDLQLTLVNQDIAFADAIRAFRAAGGKVIIPAVVGLNEHPAGSPAFEPMVLTFQADPLATPEKLRERLASQGFSRREAADAVEALVADAFREALFRRVEQAVRSGATSLEEVRAQVSEAPSLLPPLRKQYYRYLAVEAMHRHVRPTPPGLGDVIRTTTDFATIHTISEAASGTAFVDYLPMGDGVVRTVPMLVDHRGHLVPQIALALACAQLGADVNAIEAVTPGELAIPLPDGRRIRIPTHARTTSRGTHGHFLDIPWFGRSGPAQWLTMYDYPRHEASVRHLPIHHLWEAAEFRRRTPALNRDALDAMVYLYAEEFRDVPAAEAMVRNPPDPGDPDALLPLLARTLDKLKRDGTVEFWEAVDPADPTMTEEDRTRRAKALAAAGAVKAIHGQLTAFAALRQRLRAELSGKAALMGFVAVGAIADYVPTPLHPRCPGVVAHGAVFNAIMTGDFWRRPPTWVGPAIAAVLGILVTAAVALLSPAWATVAAVLLATGYTLVNGIFFFDHLNLIVPLASPLAAASGVFVAGTAFRVAAERRERARVTASLGKYVDPRLVSYVLEKDARLDGEEKELSVVFTDLAGFTTLTEKLGPRIVPLLNEYFGLMVPVVRQNKGLVNKFIGDAIMFFYGAPEENAVHAADAVRTVLEMHKVMPAFNASLAERGLPPVSFRAGISSGPMVVGNAGSLAAAREQDRASDYTVLGDNVNLASRLEGANKNFGTGVLMNQRTRDLVCDRFLCRPIARLQVKGKHEGVMTYEPIADLASATEEQRKLAALTEAFVLPYQRGDFQATLEAVARFEEALAPSELSSLYRELATGHLANPPGPDFDGQIVLTSK